MYGCFPRYFVLEYGSGELTSESEDEEMFLPFLLLGELEDELSRSLSKPSISIISAKLIIILDMLRVLFILLCKFGRNRKLGRR